MKPSPKIESRVVPNIDQRTVCLQIAYLFLLTFAFIWDAEWEVHDVIHHIVVLFTELFVLRMLLKQPKVCIGRNIDQVSFYPDATSERVNDSRVPFF